MARSRNSAALRDVVANLEGSPPAPVMGEDPRSPLGGYTGIAPPQLAAAPPIAPMSTGPLQIQMAPHVAAKPKMSKGQLIAGIFADALAGFNGQPGMMAQRWGKEREQQREEAQWHQRRQAQREDYDFQKQVDQRYKTPDEDQFTRMLRASGVDPNSPQGRALYKQKIDSDIDPIVNVPLGEGRFFSGPKSHLAAAMAGAVPPSGARPAIGAVVADPRAQGGAGSQAPRTFPGGR